MVTVLEVSTGLIHGGQTRAEGDSRLLSLLGGLLLGGLLKHLLKAGIVLARFGQQGWAVLLGQQARTGNSPVTHGHE